MLKRYIISTILILIIFIALPSYSFAAKPLIKIILTSHTEQFQEISKGLKDYLEASKINIEIEEVPLLDEGALTENFNLSKPTLVVAIGYQAGRFVATYFKEVPLIVSGVIRPELHDFQYAPVCGISLNISPETRLEYFQAVLPNLKTIGIAYNPEENFMKVIEYKKVFKSKGVEVKMIPVASSKEVFSLEWPEMNGLIIIPDSIVCQSLTAKYILQTMLKKKIPVMGISESYARSGALMAIVSDFYDVGRQTGDLVVRLLRAEPVSVISWIDSKKVVFYLNWSVARRLGIDLSQETLEKARKVFGR